MVDEAVDHRGGGHVVADDLAPRTEGLVGRDDHRRALIAARTPRLNFRLLIEAGPQALVARLLQLLWENGIPAVAAADYEDELPEGGGGKSRAVPWPN